MMYEYPYACRVDDQGNYRRVPVFKQTSFHLHRRVRLPLFPPKISNEERKLIFEYCKMNNREREFVYLLNRAEQRGLNFRKRLAARSGEHYKHVDEDMLRSWLVDRDDFLLFDI